MATHTTLKSASARRPLPPVRLANPKYEIVFKTTPSSGSVFRGLFEALGAGLSWGAGVLGSAYAEGARVVFERVEAVEDATAERRYREYAEAEDIASTPRALAAPSDHP